MGKFTFSIYFHPFFSGQHLTAVNLHYINRFFCHVVFFLHLNLDLWLVKQLNSHLVLKEHKLCFLPVRKKILKARHAHSPRMKLGSSQVIF